MRFNRVAASVALELALLAAAFVLAGVECALIGTRRSFGMRRDLLNLSAVVIVMGTLVAFLLDVASQSCLRAPLPFLALGGVLIGLPPSALGFAATRVVLRRRRTRSR
jgi:hypothetical protein